MIFFHQKGMWFFFFKKMNVKIFFFSQKNVKFFLSQKGMWFFSQKKILFSQKKNVISFFLSQKGMWKDGPTAPSDLSIWANWALSPQLRSFMEVCKKPTPTARNFAEVRIPNGDRLWMFRQCFHQQSHRWAHLQRSYHQHCHWSQQNQHIVKFFSQSWIVI